MHFYFLLFYAYADCKIPNLSVGHFNITSEKQLKDVIKKEPAFLIGLSAS